MAKSRDDDSAKQSFLLLEINSNQKSSLLFRCTSHQQSVYLFVEAKMIFSRRGQARVDYNILVQRTLIWKVIRSKVVMGIPPCDSPNNVSSTLCISPISAHHDTIKFICIHTWLCTSDVGSTNDFPFCYKAALSLE